MVTAAKRPDAEVCSSTRRFNLPQLLVLLAGPSVSRWTESCVRPHPTPKHCATSQNPTSLSLATAGQIPSPSGITFTTFGKLPRLPRPSPLALTVAPSGPPSGYARPHIAPCAVARMPIAVPEPTEARPPTGSASTGPPAAGSASSPRP